MSVPELGALILFAGELGRVVAFYRALGLPLAEERHGTGPAHFACELGGVHLAVFAAADGAPGAPSAQAFRSAGSSFPGFAVASVERTVAELRALGAEVEQEPVRTPWGVRALVRDPDGRVVEVFSRPA